MRVLRERWLADERCNPNPREENNEDFGREIVPPPNLANVENGVNIVNLLNKAEEEHWANNIQCDNQEITAENIISTVLPNNTTVFDSINTDMFGKSETELVDAQNISFFGGNTTNSEMLHLSVPDMNEVPNLAVQIEIAAAEKSAQEKHHADTYIENTVMELWIAGLHSKYPDLYNLPI